MLNEDDIEEYIVSLRSIDKLIRIIGADIRFIDAAKVDKIPWSVVKPIENLAEKVMNDSVLIMLRAKWKYNYSVITSDIKKYYYEQISSIPPLLRPFGINMQDYGDIFNEFDKPFHIISFPSIERKNILLHCLVGHEIGHLITQKYYIDDERKGNFNNKVTPQIKNYLNNNNIKNNIIVNNEVKKASFIWKRGLDELLSDIIGALIFGPAILFSTYDSAIQFKMDKKPIAEHNYYPPWRLRLKVIVDLFSMKDFKYFPITRSSGLDDKTCNEINKRANYICSEANKKNYLIEINKDPLLSIIYKEIDDDVNKGRNVLIKKLDTIIMRPNILYKNIAHLVKRIKKGITPNSYENNIQDCQIASSVEIINAAWFDKVSWGDKLYNNSTFNEDVYAKRDVLNRLVLKAIEYSYLQKEYINKKDV